jgi:hypothetical protein
MVASRIKKTLLGVFLMLLFISLLTMRLFYPFGGGR